MPLSIGEVAELLCGLEVPWWFTGGHALEMHCGRSWRDHDDIDVGICREDVGGLASLLGDWEIHVAAKGTLQPWDGAALVTRRNENNLWLRQGSGPWRLDIVVGEGDADMWIYRRDASLRVPWERAVHHTVDGTSYLAPALQLLFKSMDPRPKDDVDAAEVIPTLDAWSVALLDVRLRGNHRWRPSLDRHRRWCSSADVLEILAAVAASGADVWVDGGWGIDALVGAQTREHADLDLALPSRPVRCMSAGFQVRSHTGYEVDDTDFQDVSLLHERFGIPIPDDYAPWTRSS
jgi:hypothetical protein